MIRQEEKTVIYRAEMIHEDYIAAADGGTPRENNGKQVVDSQNDQRKFEYRSGKRETSPRRLAYLCFLDQDEDKKMRGVHQAR